MKKLVIICAALTMAASTNAASFVWKAASGRLFDGTGTDSENRYAGTGYLFNASTVSQASIIAAFISEDGVAETLSKALSLNAFSSGRTSTSDSFTGPDASFDAYFVALGKDTEGNDAVYISDTMTANYQAVGDGDIIFGQQNAYSSIGFKDAFAGYSSAGWYTAVPEPTSGILLLIGMAGLALKRKRT